jgi:C-terminal processing protease CtpA/Prc
MRKHLFLVLLVAMLSLLPCEGQTALPAVFDPAHKFSQQELRQDFAALRQVLEESHPGLYRYTSKKEMDADFERALQSIQGAMDEREFYGVVTGLLSQIKDGHTQAYLPPDFRKFLDSSAKRIPLRVRMLDRKLYVLASMDNRVPPGSELLSIQGMPVPQIMEAMFKHLSGDGDILTYKAAAIGDNFGLYYNLFLGQPKMFKVEYRAPGKQKKIALLTGVTAEITKKLGEAADAGMQKPLRYEALAVPHAARLTVETFALPPPGKGQPDFAQFLAATFQQIRNEGIEDLVIDLRGNDGGENLGLPLFSYLTDRPFLFSDSAEAASQTFSMLHQYSHLDTEFSKEFEQHLVAAGDERFKVEGNDDLAPPMQQPQKESYAGRLWVLIDGEVFSAASQFCSLVRSHRRGVFVGEETGGGYHGNSSGEEAVITLRASQLRIVVPLVRYEMAASDPASPGRGIIPDYPFQMTIQQLLDKKDAEPEYVMNLIGRERQKTKTGPQETDAISKRRTK